MVTLKARLMADRRQLLEDGLHFQANFELVSLHELSGGWL